MRLRRPILLATLLVPSMVMLAPREAAGWSRDGHRIVCRIAWRLLDDARRREVDRLVDAYRDPEGNAIATYWNSCYFADDARSKARSDTARWSRFRPFEPWHFANVARTTALVPDTACNCVISAVARHSDSLRNATTDRAKAEALFFLSHWIGDIHQPLHVGYFDDLGGNSVRPIAGGFYPANNLHSLWDGDIIAKSVERNDWQAFADRLVRDITPAQQALWIQSGPVTWAQESYNLITRPAAQYCTWTTDGGVPTCSAISSERFLAEQYQNEFADDVAQRLQQAGVRLAEYLRRHLPAP